MREQLGRYRLIRHLATGGMGEVYLAEAAGAAGFAKRLVIKTLRGDLAEDQRLVDQFVAEGRLLEALDHPNIAQIIDLGQVDETFFLAIEHVAGFDLRDLHRALPQANGGRQLPEDAVLCVLVAVAEALHHAATRPDLQGRPLRIVHHDVTPSNIMVRRDGHLKLVDFGIARSVMRDRLKQDSLRGKVPYLSPEQAAMGRVDGRADLFSLGIVGCELLAGVRPIEVTDAAGLTAAHADLPRRVHELAEIGVSDETIVLLLDMVALKRSDRIRTAALVAQRGRARLLSLGQASFELTLAAALAPAFDTLETQASGFDATLSSLLGPSSGAFEAEDVATGTVSLTGFQLARDVAQPPPGTLITSGGVTETGTTGPLVVPLRKRVIFSAFVVVVLAVVGGWWLGSSGRSGDATKSQDSDPRRAPIAVAVPDGAAENLVAATTLPETGDVGDSQPDAGGQADLAADIAVDERADAAAQFAADIIADLGKASSTGTSTKRPKTARATGTLVFLVLPADAKVAVDGKSVHGNGGRYRLQLPAGRHKVRVRDEVSGVVREKTVKLRAGRIVKLPGFQLVSGMP